MKSIRDAFEAFMQRDFYIAVVQGTRLSTNFKTYDITVLYVELFHDGRYRVVWQSQIGSNYYTPGLFMRIPALNYVEWESVHRLNNFEVVVGWGEIYKAVCDGTFKRVIGDFRSRFENALLEF